MYQIITNDQGDNIAIYVPGYTKQDISVQKNQDYIIVEGSTESPYALERQIYYKFKLTQPTKVDPELINGVLVLHLKNLGTKTLKLDIR